MRQIEFDTSGIPTEVARCAEVPDPVLISDDAIFVSVNAFPINPADLLLSRGV